MPGPRHKRKAETDVDGACGPASEKKVKKPRTVKACIASALSALEDAEDVDGGVPYMIIRCSGDVEQDAVFVTTNRAFPYFDELQSKGSLRLSKRPSTVDLVFFNELKAGVKRIAEAVSTKFAQLRPIIPPTRTIDGLQPTGPMEETELPMEETELPIAGLPHVAEEDATIAGPRNPSSLKRPFSMATLFRPSAGTQ